MAIKKAAKRASKKVGKKAVVVKTATPSKEVEVEVSEISSTTERDEAFYKAHTGAREDVIYG